MMIFLFFSFTITSFDSKSYRDVSSNDMNAAGWSHYVMKRFLDVLSTHSIQVDFGEKGKLLMDFRSFNAT